ncbi:uncharacterized protein LOC132912762 isoform X3 [Bombus pascuorum]|uniref:uncharacterized protein LOC132912762 isoform X3 n=1 Tax=Bombus pascuorum TaxID=65598 RepID=UPI00298E8F80|nr:uncharacterized protein LOC132912762 isoform X3 [Bombus pascuorum]
MNGKMLMSPGMSLVVAGVASGICFLIYSGVLRGKSGDSKEDEKQIPVSKNRCSCCLKPFFLGRGVRCEDCGGKSCRKGCSRWDPSDNAWHCLFCRQQRYWLKKNGVEAFGGPIDEKDLHRYFNTAKSQVYVAGVENAATSSGRGLATKEEEANTMETVRDFVEKIVVRLMGNLNDTPIHRLYDHPAYDKLMERHITPLVDALSRLAMALRLSLENKPSTDSPTMAHTALREIVERAVDEARKLPGLGGSGVSGNAPEARNVVEDSYEDILATAILNKVIEKFQKEQVDGNSNVLPGKPVSAKCALSENEAGLDEGVEEGCSSLEPLSQDDCSSDCSASCSRRVRNQPEPLSLTIEERIEEVTTTYASDEDHREHDILPIKNAHRVPFPELGMDIIDPCQESEDSQDDPDTTTTHIGLVSPIESWEENWLFQKKRVQSQADPVAMLVPHPSADFKALIGDKDAEDTSDLSECSSAQSDEEIEKELMEAISSVVPRSPKKKEFENGLEYLNSSDDFSLQKDDVNSFSNGGYVYVSDEEKTDRRRVKDQRKAEKQREKEEDYKQSVKGNEEVKAKEIKEKEVKRKLERVETEDEKPVSESINVISNGLKKVGMERQKTNNVSDEDKTRNLINGDNFIKVDRSLKKSESDNLSNSVNSKPLTIILPDESELNVPKTPTPTPTRISMEINLGNPHSEKTCISQEKIVLNSLECAKKKLMAVNDDSVEAFEDEETMFAQQKVDFHAEDIQQESEYTEHYDIATQRHLDSLTKSESFEFSPLTNSSIEDDESKCRQAVAFAKAESASHLSLQNKDPEEEGRLGTPPRPGTIAEREHKKWENAPPIENNPYSQENIQKRLLERQYSRRSSDIPGIHTELPKSNGADMDVVLAPHEPDIKRFGRDYYINDSRASGNEKGRRSTASTSSRPSSSLSQRSSSNGIADPDQQEETQYRETETILNRSNDVKSKVAKWQNNNVENKYQQPVGQNDSSDEAERDKDRFSKIESQMSWDDQRMEEILENERKNSKNEINAKLNNQENYENAVIETKKSNSDENPRKIKRIDLKAYGFENEFSNKTAKTSTPRVVNKLDLKSFGYDNGIRRTQSTIQLNSIGNDEFKPRLTRTSNKSNLTRRNDYDNDRGDVIESNRASGDNNLTQSTETLNKYENESYNDFGLKSAKSVPNIAKFYSNPNSQEDEEVESYNQNSYNEFGMVKKGSVRNIANNYSLEKCNIKSNDSSVDDSENETDNSFEREQSHQSMSDVKKKSLSEEEFDNKVLPMPSVRRLAEAFSKQTEPVPGPISKITKSSNANKERSSTPEIQIVETPRQMHSLTARSLSKQFREGLRQIPNKVTSPPASHVVMEQPNITENQTEVVQGKSDVSNDTNVILPGKLKSNIIFWEQMQRKS